MEEALGDPAPRSVVARLELPGGQFAASQQIFFMARIILRRSIMQRALDANQ
jgi:hypothetical protein